MSDTVGAMSRARRLARVLSLVGWWMVAPPPLAHAQGAPPGDLVEQAERAYREVDFPRQRALARQALEQGNADPARVAQIYRLLGIAHAVLGEPEVAKEAFARLLELDPSIELQRSLSPRIRSPYMEARGERDVASEHLGLSVIVFDAKRGLSIAVFDPKDMVRRVRLRVGANEPAAAGIPVAPELYFPPTELRPGSRHRVELLDEYSNVLALRDLPELAAPAAAPVVRATSTAEPARVEESSSGFTAAAPWLIGGGGALVALGVGAHLIREKEATTWNGSDCEQPGQGRRIDQCSDVDHARSNAQTVAIVSYSVGGALLVAGLVATGIFDAADSDSSPKDGALRCDVGPGALGVACGSTF